MKSLDVGTAVPFGRREEALADGQSTTHPLIVRNEVMKSLWDEAIQVLFSRDDEMIHRCANVIRETASRQ